jgi:hypothetical protein
MPGLGRLGVRLPADERCRPDALAVSRASRASVCAADVDDVVPDAGRDDDGPVVLDLLGLVDRVEGFEPSNRL